MSPWNRNATQSSPQELGKATRRAELDLPVISAVSREVWVERAQQSSDGGVGGAQGVPVRQSQGKAH